MQFVKEGFVACATFDPVNGRHHTKKAAVRREFDRQRSVAECITAKTKIMEMSHDLREGNCQNEEEKKIICNNLKDLDKKVKKGEMRLQMLNDTQKLSTPCDVPLTHWLSCTKGSLSLLKASAKLTVAFNTC